MGDNLKAYRAEHPDGPYDDRGPALVAVQIISTAIATAFVVWRLVVVAQTRRRFAISDYLIFISAILAIVANTFSSLSTRYGQGKHLWDPAINTADLVYADMYLYFARAFNLYSMGTLRLSIALYLVGFNFSPIYRAIIWFTAGLVSVTIIIIPTIVLWGSCKPVSSNWDHSIKGDCWPPIVFSANGYSHTSTNILTDIIFTAAPIVYLASVQLPRRTQWGLRVVFCVGLFGTACSIVKLTEFRKLSSKYDNTYEWAPLSIWSAVEVAVVMIAACLPHLRKTFDSLLKRVVPSSVYASSASYSQSRAGAVSSRFQKYALSSRKKSSPHSTEQPAAFQLSSNDDNSERGILPDDDVKESKPGDIMKTTKVSVMGEDKSESDKDVYNDWERR